MSVPSQVNLEQVWRQQLATLAEEASAGDPIWRRPGFIEGGLPVHALSGQPFPGIDALVLWRFGPGPGPHACHCGLSCKVDSECSEAGQPVCCPSASGDGTCTDACTCYCD